MSTRTKTFPIVEIFGPVLQGEGRMIGTPTHFVRLGYCDYRCSWCLGANTLITLATGQSKQISQVEVGDILMGFDEHNGTLQPTTVTRIVQHAADDLWFFGVGNSALQTRMVATAEHVWMTNRGWIATAELVPGDTLWSGYTHALALWQTPQASWHRMQYARSVAHKSAGQPVLRPRVRQHTHRPVVQQPIAAPLGMHLLDEPHSRKKREPSTKLVAGRSNWSTGSIDPRAQRLIPRTPGAAE